MAVRAWKLCTICGATFPTAELRTEHVAGAHPGLRMGWGTGKESRRPAIIDEATGERRLVPPAEYGRMRAKALRDAAQAAAPRVTLAAAPSAGPTTADEPVSPTSTRPGTSSVPPRARPFVTQPPLTLTRETARAAMGDEVREHLTLELLCDVIVDLSRSLSDADGAGEAGVLSRVQGMMVARLLYEPTVDLIIVRFAGNVGRFRMALAAIVILSAKGRVHAAAIMSRARARRAGTTYAGEPIEDAPADGETEHEEAADEAAEPEQVLVSLDPIADLARRQRAAAGR